MIEKMTPEQEAFLPVYRQQWIDNGMRTDSDPAEMRASVKALYASHELDEPVVFVCDSPALCLLLRAVLRANLGDNLWDNLGANLRDNLWANLRDNLWANLGANLGANLRDNLWDNLRANLGANLRANLWDNLGANLGANLRDNLRDNLWANLYDLPSLWGGFEVGWLAFYDFPRTLGHVFPNELSRKLNATVSYAKTCGWLYAYKKVAFASQRPTEIHRLEDGRIHNANGPAIGFSDGYGVYAWNGIRVPEKWITDKKSLTARIAITWQNIEQRRAAIEILGWARILNELAAKTIDESGNPLVGTLIEVDLPDVGPSRFCRVLCGTNREFAIGVPNNIKTALEAQAWMQNTPAKEFNIPEVRT